MWRVIWQNNWNRKKEEIIATARGPPKTNPDCKIPSMDSENSIDHKILDTSESNLKEKSIWKSQERTITRGSMYKFHSSKQTTKLQLEAKVFWETHDLNETWRKETNDTCIWIFYAYEV